MNNEFVNVKISRRDQLMSDLDNYYICSNRDYSKFEFLSKMNSDRYIFIPGSKCLRFTSNHISNTEFLYELLTDDQYNYLLLKCM